MNISLLICVGLSLIIMKRLTSDCLMYKVTKVKDGNSAAKL